MKYFKLIYLSVFFGIVSILALFNITYSYYLNLYLNLNTYIYTFIVSIFLAILFYYIKNDDEDNLMVSVLVEKFAKDKSELNDNRTMALINKPNYSLLQSSQKIDDFIDPRMNTVSSILKHIHKGTIENAYSILNGEYEIIEAEIIETSELVNKELKNSNLPDEIRIGAILRGDEVIIPRSNFVFKKQDIVVLLAKKDVLHVVENMFRISSI